MKNIFVMGLDDFHLDLLQSIDNSDEYRFLPLFDYRDVVHPAGLEYPSMESMLEHARERFREQPGGADAVIGYWDLPTSLAVPLIARETGLPGAPLEAVARCEHKYWSRCEQQKAVPEMVGKFQAIDPFCDDPLADLELDYPFWIKPIKAHSSFLGFYIDRRETFDQHIDEIRQNIGVMARPMNEFLAHVELPEAIAPIDGYHCIIEEIVSQGFQCTLEGYCWRDGVEIFGVVDSLRSGKHKSCFARYQYPSKLPQPVQNRMKEAAAKVMRRIGYDGAAFNIEFFWDSSTDRIRLLEINSRISKSHSPLFLMVDGAPNQKVIIDLALGRKPDFPHRKGDFRLAAKFMLRYFEDGILERVPSESDIENVRRRYPEARIRRLADQGTRLADIQLQDSYSFEVADIFLGADRQKELLDKYDDVCRRLDYKVVPLESEAA